MLPLRLRREPYAAWLRSCWTSWGACEVQGLELISAITYALNCLRYWCKWFLTLAIGFADHQAGGETVSKPEGLRLVVSPYPWLKVAKELQVTCSIHVVILEAKSIRKVELIGEIAWHAEDPEVLGLATECTALAISVFQHHFRRGDFVHS